MLVEHKRNPKKRLKIPSPDECDFKEHVTLSKQPEKDSKEFSADLSRMLQLASL